MDNTSPTNQYSGSTAQNEDEIDFLLGALLDQKWTVISSTVASLHTLFTLATPSIKLALCYKLKRRRQASRVLRTSPRLSALSPQRAELEILKSRSVVGTAATNLNSLSSRAQALPAIGDFVYS